MSFEITWNSYGILYKKEQAELLSAKKWGNGY